MATTNTVSNNSAAAAAAAAAAAMAVSSPRHAGDSVSSPKSRRGTRSGTPPWTQIVRGESEPIAAVPSSPSAASSTAVIEPVVAASSSSSSSTSSVSSSPAPVEESVGESSDNGSGLNGNAGKRPAWNKPSNGAAEVGPVMGAVSWPPLSESTRASTKSSSPESSKGSLDGSSSVSFSVSQGTGTTTITPPQKQPNPASTPNHIALTRQRSMKRNNANAPSNGGNPQQQPSASHAFEMSPNNPSPKDNTQRSGFGSQTHSGGDHPQQRNSFRRNGGSHPRGDGSHHHNYGSRRDHDRGNQDWNSPRNFSGRDHMHRGGPRFRNPAPPVSSTSFIAPQPVRPYGVPISFAELAPPLLYVAPPPESLRMPFVAPIAPLYFPPPDHQLHSKILGQIDYYFSNENLIKDTYLRQNMDDQGWVPIKLIAGFNKVMNLTENIQVILDAIRMSNVVEVQGDKVRRRNDWMRWIMPPSVQFPNVQSPQTPGKSSHDMLAPHVQSIALEEKNTSHSSVQAGADRSISARN